MPSPRRVRRARSRDAVSVPEVRVRACNARPARADGAYVLYWITAFRRTGWNFALQRAVEHARAFARPLVVLEALRCDDRWASDRLHAFVIQGMADNARALLGTGVTYLPYVEPEPGSGRGLLEALAARACLVVGDDAPPFFLPRALTAAAARVPVRLEAVDSNGLLPLAATERVFPTAFALPSLPPGHAGGAPRAVARSRPARGRRAAEARPRSQLMSCGAGRPPRRRCSRARSGRRSPRSRWTTGSRWRPKRAAAPPQAAAGSGASSPNVSTATPRRATSRTKTAAAGSRPTSTSATFRPTRRSPRWRRARGGRRRGWGRRRPGGAPGGGG